MEKEIKNLTNGQIYSIYESLKELYLNKDLEFPIEFLYYLYRNIQIIEPIAVSINQVFKRSFEGVDLNDCDNETKKRYDDFCNIKNNVMIETCPLSILKDINLSLHDYQSIDFMIKVL